MLNLKRLVAVKELFLFTLLHVEVICYCFLYMFDSQIPLCLVHANSDSVGYLQQVLLPFLRKGEAVIHAAWSKLQGYWAGQGKWVRLKTYLRFSMCHTIHRYHELAPNNPNPTFSAILKTLVSLSWVVPVVLFHWNGIQIEFKGLIQHHWLHSQVCDRILKPLRRCSCLVILKQAIGVVSNN